MSDKTFADYQAAAAALHELADEMEQTGANDYNEFLGETIASGDVDTIKRVRDLDQLAFSWEPDLKDVPDVLREAVSDNFVVLTGDNGRSADLGSFGGITQSRLADARVALDLVAEMERTGAETIRDLVEETDASGDFDAMLRVRELVLDFVNITGPDEVTS